jgi:hypothetical protein
MKLCMRNTSVYMFYRTVPQFPIEERRHKNEGDLIPQFTLFIYEGLNKIRLECNLY